MAKVMARIPVSQMPCIVAKHRSEASDEEFESTWDKPKSQMHACSIVDPLDEDWNAPNEESGSVELPSFYDPKANMPRAEAVVNDERYLIPSCAAHVQEVQHLITRGKIMLHGLRPRLNPGESEVGNRKFFQWSRDRRDRIMKRRSENAKRYKQFDVAQNRQQSNSPINEPEDDVEIYSDETPRSFSTWNVKNLLAPLFPESNNEEDEPDLGVSLPIEEFEK